MAGCPGAGGNRIDGGAATATEPIATPPPACCPTLQHKAASAA